MPVALVVTVTSLPVNLLCEFYNDIRPQPKRNIMN